MKFGDQLASLIVEEWRQFYLDYERIKKLIETLWPRKKKKKGLLKRLSKMLKSDKSGKEEESRGLLEHAKSDYLSTSMITPTVPPSPLSSKNIQFVASSVPPSPLVTKDTIETAIRINQAKQSAESKRALTRIGKHGRVNFEEMGLFMDTTDPEDKRKAQLVFSEIIGEFEKVEAFYAKIESKLSKNFEGLSMQAASLRQRHHEDPEQEEEVKETAASPGVGQGTPRPKMLRSKTAGSNMHNMAVESNKDGFLHQYREENMLLNYVSLNYTGFDKLMKTFDKYTGNSSRQTFRERTLLRSYFVRSRVVNNLLKLTEELFADQYECGDVGAARVRLLEKMTDSQYSKLDMFRFGTKFGTVCCLLLLTCYALWASRHLPEAPDLNAYNYLSFIPVYRGIGLLICFLWLWGANVYVWQRFRINYVYIFEFSPRDRLTHMQVFEEAADITIVFLVNLLLFLSHTDLGIHVPGVNRKWYPLSLFVYLILKAILPFPLASHWTSRKCLLGSLWNIAIAPFGRVRFRDAYIGDILTSMVKVLVDLSYDSCYYFTGAFLYSPTNSANMCTNAKWLMVPIVSAMPLYFRFQQNMKVYYQTGKRWPSLGNACKYALAHTVVIAGSFHPFFSFGDADGQTHWEFSREFWLVSCILSTIYTFMWDCKMDWGLWNPQAPADRKFLRPNLMYNSPWIYYFIMASNLFLRFSWTITLTPFDWRSGYDTMLVPLLVLAEGYRRFQWGLLRVEWEHIQTSGEVPEAQARWSLSNESTEPLNVSLIPMFFDNSREQKARLATSREGYIVIEVLLMILLLLLIAFVSAVM